MSSIQLRQAVRRIQSQGLHLSTQVYQAIELLNLTQEDLEAFLAEKLLENPFLCVRFAEPRLARSSRDGLDRVAMIEARCSNSETLAQSLGSQLRLMGAGEDVTLRAVQLANSLDEDGYLDPPVDFDPQVEPVDEAALDLLQSCEPAGVGARDLAECLKLQLVERGECRDEWMALLENLSAVASRQVGLLRQVCGVSDVRLAQMIEVLGRLDPRPARCFASGPAVNRVPDVRLRVGPDGGWIIRLTADEAIELSIDEETASRMRIATRSDRDRSYVDEQIDQAKWLQTSLRRRSETMLKVVAEICVVQDEALNVGLDALKPLTMQCVADSIGVHESTVSRCVAGKSIDTPFGLIPLRRFFATEFAQEDGASLTSERVGAEIARIIEAESPDQPLSDKGISQQLCRSGLVVARRTISKYRERLGYQASGARRREREFRAFLER